MVKNKNGVYTQSLWTDDNLILAFNGMIESTPETLADEISLESLDQIAKESIDINERIKAEKALSIAITRNLGDGSTSESLKPVVEPTYANAVTLLRNISNGYDKEWSIALSSGNLTGATVWAIKKQTIDNAVVSLQDAINEMDV